MRNENKNENDDDKEKKKKNRKKKIQNYRSYVICGQYFEIQNKKQKTFSYIRLIL